MRHPTSHRPHTAGPREESATVKSALKETLADELAAQATNATLDETTPEHLAGPGRLRATPRG